MTRAVPGDPTWRHLAPFRDELRDRSEIFVIDSD